MLRTRAQRRSVKDRIGADGGEAKTYKKPYKSCRRGVGNGGDLDGNRNKRRQESVGLVAADPDNLEDYKEPGGKQGIPSLSKTCTSRESVSPLSRLIKGFCNKCY